jgi:hypothetical protein
LAREFVLSFAMVTRYVTFIRVPPFGTCCMVIDLLCSVLTCGCLQSLGYRCNDWSKELKFNKAILFKWTLGDGGWFSNPSEKDIAGIRPSCAIT